VRIKDGSPTLTHRESGIRDLSRLHQGPSIVSSGRLTLPVTVAETGGDSWPLEAIVGPRPVAGTELSIVEETLIHLAVEHLPATAIPGSRDRSASRKSPRPGVTREAHGCEPAPAGPTLEGLTNRRLDMEYLVIMTTRVSEGTPADEVDDVRACAAALIRDLAVQGHPVRLWTPPGPRRGLGLRQAQEVDQMREILRSLPSAGWLTTETVPLTRHPNHPGSVGA
jgi:muconolactone delta-isomerase